MGKPARFLMKETIFLKNSINITHIREFKGNFVKVEPLEDRIIITYGFESNLKPENILKQRLMISEIIQGVIGEGFKNYDTELYHIRERSMVLVGFVHSRLPYLTGSPLLKSARECLELITLIIDSQLKYKSLLVDGLLAAISHANSGGLVDNLFGWAWRGFAYLIESLDAINRAPRKLDYQVISSDRQPRKVRTIFKQKILKAVQEFEEYITKEYEIEESTDDKLELEIKSLREKINQDILNVDFIEKFDNQIQTLNNFVLDFIFLKDRWPSMTEICKQFSDWNAIKDNLIKTAKKARDVGFHEGGYSGLLEGEKFDTYHGSKRFVAWVCMLLSIILTNEPHIYDNECKKDRLRFNQFTSPDIEFQIEQLTFPENGVLEWDEYDNGGIVTKQVSVTHVVEKPNFVLEFKSENQIPPHPRTILIEMKRPKFLDYVFKGKGIIARGELECDSDIYRLKILKLFCEYDY